MFDPFAVIPYIVPAIFVVLAREVPKRGDELAPGAPAPTAP